MMADTRHEPEPGVMHEIDQAFYDLAIKERDYERHKVDRLNAVVERLHEALNKPLRETIVAVLMHMPKDAQPEHLAAQIESQVRAWQAIPSKPEQER